MSNLDRYELLRLPFVIGDKKKDIPAIIPVSRSAWMSGVKSGIYPKPVLLGKKTIAWRASDIRNLLESLSGVAA